MSQEPVTGAHVQEMLRLLAGIEVDADEAAAVARMVEANRHALEMLDRFDVGEVRPAVLFDPTR